MNNYDRAKRWVKWKVASATGAYLGWAGMMKLFDLSMAAREEMGLLYIASLCVYAIIFAMGGITFISSPEDWFHDD